MNYVKPLFSALFFMSMLTACGGGGGCASSAECNKTANTAAGTTTTFVATPSSAVSVAIGQGDTIETTAADIKYKKRFAVTVSDDDGKPVIGAKVSLGVFMVGFYKGRFFRNTETFKITGRGIATASSGSGIDVPAGDLLFCPAEDINNNDIMDPSEDINNDKSLTPARAEVVAVIEGTDITNAQGIVYVVAEYYKSSATWIEYELVAAATVTGTEGRVSKFRRTSYVVGDEEKPQTQFVFSPFGITAGCNNAN